MKKIINHLKENWIRYSFETLVVVLGVLIAFALSSWNENRKNRNAEQRYLLNLQEEFETNLIELERRIAQNVKFMNSTELLLTVYTSDTIVDPTIMAMAVEFCNYGGPSNIQSNVWQDLVSSGNLGLISNTHLRHRISKYFNFLDKHWEFYRNIWRISLNDSERMCRDIIPSSDRMTIADSFPLYIKGAINDYPRVSVDFDFIKEKLEAKKELEGVLATTYHIHDTNVFMTQNTINSTKEIIKILDEEIEKFN